MTLAPLCGNPKEAASHPFSAVSGVRAPTDGLVTRPFGVECVVRESYRRPQGQAGSKPCRGRELRTSPAWCCGLSTSATRAKPSASCSPPAMPRATKPAAASAAAAAAADSQTTRRLGESAAPAEPRQKPVSAWIHGACGRGGLQGTTAGAGGGWSTAGSSAKPRNGNSVKAADHADPVEVDATTRKGKTFRGGSKQTRDNWYGYDRDQSFVKWWHRQGKKEFGGNDIDSAAEAKAIYEHCVQLGKPVPK